MLRKTQNKEKQLAISQKVKKMFRYSPSYQTQKCHSKFPLKYSNASTRNNDTQLHKNSEINCEYSSVKQKQFESNQCNDTSSWIAKLVSGIQDQDEENKMLHRLSQIENKSINDLPQDSQDYDGYNQFLLEKADSLFTQKDKQMHTNFSNQPLFLKQAPITKPMKKSIKQAMIEIQMKQNLDGLRVPPVTRDSSCTKRENVNKIISQKEIKIQKTKITPRKSQTRKSLSTTKSRTSLLPQKPKSEIKNKNKKVTNRNDKTFDQIISKDPSPQVKKGKINLQQKGDSTIQFISHKNSMVSIGTKKQSIHRVRYETQEFPTRKNSFIDGTDLQDKEEFRIVDEHSKHLNMKNLFEEQKHIQTKPCSSQNLVDEIPVSGQKRIGSIKKNKKNVQNKQNVKSYFSQNDSTNTKYETKINPLNQQLSSIQLESNRNINNFTLNRKNFEQNILVELSSNRIRSNRCNFVQNLDATKILPQSQQNRYSNRKDWAYQKKSQVKIQKEQKNQNLNHKQIHLIFNKIRLDQQNPILSRNNLKLRGLTEEQKTQLGSIITKIHYQNATYDLQTFSKEFTKMNYQCSLKGCLSQQKLKKYSSNQIKKNTINQPQKEIKKNQVQFDQQRQQNDQNRQDYREEQSYFGQNEQLNQISSALIPGIGHRRRTSNIVKKKLFDQINRISYLQEVASNQLQKNSRVNINSKTNDKICSQRITNENFSSQKEEQIITKDPYIEGPSLVDIQITKRDLPSSHRTAASSENGGHQYNKINLGFISNLQNTEDQEGMCLIERLNKKLTTYIDKNQILSTYRQFNLNFSELKKHIR